MTIVREYECGCKITSENNYPSIEYCPKHKVAPDLYEALKKVVKRGVVYEGGGFEYVFKALAKAERK